MIAKIIKHVLSRMGYSVVPVTDMTLQIPTIFVKHTSLLRHRRDTEFINGMIAPESADILYAICRTQQIDGDVLEIGSWQGKSTSYFAKAVVDSNNGHVYAVDHFKGNIGREREYSFGTTKEYGNKDIFSDNMRTLGLAHAITLLPTDSDTAYKQLKDKRFRLIFIDGDHSYEGVKRDISLFCPLLKPGGCIVFDDFDMTFPGVVKAVDEWTKERTPRVVFSQRNMLICQY